ncbi:hypothetical protein D3C84_1090140 [compost metagenome]
MSAGFPELKKVCDESDYFHGDVCTGGVHNTGAGEHRGIEFGGAVWLSRQSTARSRGNAGVCIVAGVNGAGAARGLAAVAGADAGGATGRRGVFDVHGLETGGGRWSS